MGQIEQNIILISLVDRVLLMHVWVASYIHYFYASSTIHCVDINIHSAVRVPVEVVKLFALDKPVVAFS